MQVLVTQAQGPDSGFQYSFRKLNRAASTCNPRTGEAETGELLMLTSQLTSQLTIMCT